MSTNRGRLGPRVFIAFLCLWGLAIVRYTIFGPNHPKYSYSTRVDPLAPMLANEKVIGYLRDGEDPFPDFDYRPQLMWAQYTLSPILVLRAASVPPHSFVIVDSEDKNRPAEMAAENNWTLIKDLGDGIGLCRKGEDVQ